MSSNVGFLLIPVVVAVVGSLWLWLRNRKPTTTMSSVESFQREMQALGRPPEPTGGRRRPRRGRTRPDPIVPTPGPTGLGDELRSARRTGGSRREG